jgi:hypothetical protein
MARRDDDALSWGGDDDPTLDVGVPHDASSDAADALPPGYTAVGRGSARTAPSVPPPPAGDAASTSDAGTAPAGNAALVAMGVIGGIYLLLALGWLIGGLRLHGVAGYLVAADGVASPVWAAGTLAAVWLAVLAPLIWFVTVFVATRRSRPWLRWLLWAAGVLLLLPWPFIMVGTVGS